MSFRERFLLSLRHWHAAACVCVLPRWCCIDGQILSGEGGAYGKFTSCLAVGVVRARPAAGGAAARPGGGGGERVLWAGSRCLFGQQRGYWHAIVQRGFGLRGQQRADSQPRL